MRGIRFWTTARLAALAVAPLVAGSVEAGQAVLNNGVALRAGPDPLYEAIYSGAAGTTVETLEATLTWTYIRLPNNARGWVPTAALVGVGTVVPRPSAPGFDTAPSDAPFAAAATVPTRAPEVDVSVAPLPRPGAETPPVSNDPVGEAFADTVTVTPETGERVVTRLVPVPETSGDVMVVETIEADPNATPDQDVADGAGTETDVPSPDTETADEPIIAAVEPEAVPMERVEAYTSVVWPPEGRLNLRAGPGTGFLILDQMDRGDWVEVSARAGEWVKVTHESGLKGWAHEGFLTR